MGSVLRAAAHHGSDSNSGDGESKTGGAGRPALSLEMEQGRESRAPARSADGDDRHNTVWQELASERAREELAEREYLHVIRWAMYKAPDLLRALKTAYLFGQDSSAMPDEPSVECHSGGGALRPRSSWRSSLVGIARPSDKLQDVEREHIRRILRESATAVEAALKLGINNSTLWRKRKRYNL